jgi:phosphatidylserine decarboxylase
MKHKGKARKAAWKMILVTLVAILVVLALGALATVVGTVLLVFVPPILLGIWIIFSLFTLYFFRDPTPTVPQGANLVLSPAHGKVDVVDTTTEAGFMGGECQRISVFLNVFNVHVQNAPVGGKIMYYKYTVGEFINAMRAESATHNENLLIGFETAEPAGEKVGLRLIAGVIARRIVPFIKAGDEVARGERISLIQFGSRADIYLPRRAKIRVKVNDRVVGGETVLAVFE